MKILYHHRIAARDGMDVHKTELIKAFRGLGHEVIEVGPTGQQKAEFGAGGGWVDTLRRHLPKVVAEGLEILYDQYAWRRLKSAYLKHQPDILYERHNLFLSAGKRLKKKYGILFLLEVNSPLAEERSKNGGLALASFAHAQEGRIWRAADHIFPVTAVLATYLAAKGVAEERIKVIPNAVDRDVFHPGVDGALVRKEYGLEDALVLGFTGFIRDWHGLDQIIDLLPEMVAKENIHFLVVGDGPVRTALEAQAAKRGVSEHVHFTGIISRKEIPNYIATFDMALQPAVTPYASPLKLFEYLAMGKLVLAPDTENIREVIEDGVNGWTFSTQSSTHGLKELLLKTVSRTNPRAPSWNDHQSQRTWKDNAIEILSEKV